MATAHTVALGDCIGSLARQHGFGDHTTIYDDGANAKLKADRPNPNVLAEGDVVQIPDLAAKQAAAATDGEHRFTARLPAAKFVLVVQDDAGTALANLKYKLTVGAAVFEGKTAGDGRIEHPIAPDASAGTLELWTKEGAGIDGMSLALELGSLEHESKDRACQARLLNLGFDCGGTGGTVDAATHAALRGFQKLAKLPTNGQLNASTRTELRKRHEGA